MTRKDINYVNLNKFSEVKALIDSLDLSSFPVPDYCPPQNGLWHNLDTQEVTDTLPSSVYVVDYETICETRVLVMGTAFDYLNRQLWMMVSEPDTNIRVKTSGKFIGVAHSSSFENSFHRDAYSLDCQTRWFCTKSIAACRYHPCQVALYRSQPYLPMFRESNDLSLAELSLKLTSRAVDKSAVEVFIKAQDESWRVSKFIIHKDCKINLEKAFKLNSHQCANLEQFAKHFYPTGSPDDDIDQGYLTSKKAKSVKYVWRVTETIEQLMEYNCTDVSVTCGVFQSLWQWYRDFPESFQSGCFQRSVPFLPLANDWRQQINIIEAEFASRLKQLTERVSQVEQEYLEVVGQNDFDSLDWKIWTKTASADKAGKIKWLGTTGLSSKQLMRISRLSWEGRPLVALPQTKTDADLNPIVKKDGTESVYLQWYTVKPIFVGDEDEPNWLASVTAKEEMEPWDNPNNTNKDMKDTISVFSKSFLPYWESGQLTSQSPVAEEIANIYSTISFWQSFRDRIINKSCIYFNGQFLSLALRPHVVGTVTGRAIDPIGLVWSKADENKVGSEISGHVCSPDGYQIISADFDSLQANITAFYAAIETARKLGVASKPINVLNNPFSVSILTGNKENQTTLAYLIAVQTGLWRPEMDKAQKASGYSLAKNISYALLFGAGESKLVMMTGSEKLAKDIMSYFKGVMNRQTRKYEGGIASNYFNYAAELANGLYQGSNGRFWVLPDEMHSTFLKRELPRVLCPSNRKRDLATTAANAVVQAIDPEFLNYQVDYILRKCDEQGIFVRYLTTVHDDLKLLIKTEDADKVSEIFQQGHRRLYEDFCDALNVDKASLPENVWRYSSVDVNPRYTKSVGDLGKTLSNVDGYDYSVVADFIYPDEEKVYHSEDFVSSAKIKSFYKQEVTRQLVGANVI